MAVNAPETVARIGRTGVAGTVRPSADSATIVAPAVERTTFAALHARSVDAPLVVRPVGSQAGIGLALIASSEDVHVYLSERDDPEYFVMPFVDYRSADQILPQNIA